ncbi:MAG: hypothetical protein Q9187_004493 [Circinaria calcarea]
MVEVKVLVVSPGFETKFKSKVDHVVCIPQILLDGDIPKAGPSCKMVRLELAAFVVFTSGSTGQPKGVIKDHTSISTSALAHTGAFLVNSSSRALQFAAYVCWIVDTSNHDRLVSIGGVGEFLVEGRIIARSYLDDQTNTDAAFITNPAWQHAFPIGVLQLQRYYKTGDLVRYDLDGKIVLIGRKDSLVKLRGQRIELAEVEYYLQQYLPDVGEVAAGIVTIPEARERKTLAAFICPGPEPQSISSKDTSTWKSQVTLLIKGLEAESSSSLPAYMIPSIYFPITELPRTASGVASQNGVKIFCSAEGYLHREREYIADSL